MYQYAAQLVKVVDGDTIDINTDLGFHITVLQRCRLRGVNCPEVHGASRAAGLAATQFTTDWLKKAADWGPLEIKSSKPYPDDKYGRFLVEVSSPVFSATLNAALLESKNAVPFMVDE